MRIVKDPDTRKQEILSGALKVFARKGYEKTTISDIAGELGISQGLCYRYYASKEAIYDAALDEYASIIADSNLERFDSNGKTLKEKIRAFSGSLKEYRKPEKDNELLYSLFHGENSQKMHDQLMLKTAAKLIPHIKRVLQKAKEDGEITISDVDAFAYFFVYGQLGILMECGSQKDCDKRIQDLLIDVLQLLD